MSCSSLTMVFFFGGLPFALYSARFGAVVQLSLLSRHSVRVAVLFGPLALHLAASTTVSLKWYSDSPFNPSFETLGLR